MLITSRFDCTQVVRPQTIQRWRIGGVGPQRVVQRRIVLVFFVLAFKLKHEVCTVPDEMQELQEHAEHGAHEKTLAPVTITMAILAVLVAAVSLLGHRAHTEELLHQTKATDQWAYYQAKDIRRHTYELFLDEMSVFTTQNPVQIQKIREKYQKEVERYRD